MDREAISRWVEAYERAWRTSGTGQLRELFAPDGLLQMPAWSRHRPDEQSVVVPEPTPQGLAQLRDLAAQPTLGQLGQHVGVTLAGDEGFP